MTFDSWADNPPEGFELYGLPDDCLATIGTAIDYGENDDLLVHPSLRRGANIALIHGGLNYGTRDLELGWARFNNQDIV